MIKSFIHKGLEKYFYTGSKRGIKPEHAKKLGKILDRLHAATELRDMHYPGSNLHLLRGQYEGMYAVSVSGNWRIIFRFEQGHALDVDYRDYH
ncbi:MAG: type II toxin-antitoxin system RelE/ParE family toxin [Deltaproteobacteria bacterium]|nr:type II toxin-antitoxin system RelE/ParE family toxin [Deltaproteobacteria bacterium]MBW1960994.1 type II toxin-antitoxin system RelE/ParE family toxin [Deltaproteobacteria bacterium]MBW1992919.1 type II toxin-antitoxin system RelE/ParE family toxin [Deltaproteobacteria bacterium]MBW2152761.1 type II toxin-antitoxin system RelE/ParE family toxin [Deltaproteobacteria bacterium]